MEIGIRLVAQNYDISTINAKKSILDGIARVEGIVDNDRLFIDQTCTETLAALDQYQWDPNPNLLKEKPKHKFYVNAGIYVLDPKCIDLIPKKSYDMPLVFKKIIAAKNKTISFPLEEYWLDIGRPNDFDKASIEYDSIFNKRMK